MNKQDLAKRISDLLIIKQDDSYHLFGQYLINRQANGLYSLESHGLTFSQLKHAVTWCVFHKNKKHKDLKKIEDLDEQLSGLLVTINIHKTLALKSKSVDDQSIHLAKLIEDKLKRQTAQKAMDYYVDVSKYWQTKAFKDNQVH